ncbi:hypothetical protein HUW46_02399 [Amycolatopsis sp. CA-230715]|nr:hypothetical protein HUW46_02399 [Amycolatopsis sp. CA-230715]
MVAPGCGLVASDGVWKALWRRRVVVLEVAIWLFLCGMVFEEHPGVLTLVLGLLSVTVSVATARWSPLVSLVAAAVTSVDTLFNFADRVPAWPIGLMVVMCCFAGRRMPRAREALIAFAAIGLAGVPVSFAVNDTEMADWGAMAAVLLFAGLLPWQVGRYLRLREDLVRTGWQRAEDLENQQRIVADQARLRERARIASDMHDSLGHELALIAVRAAALEVAGGLGESQQREAAELRKSAAVATDRLRQIIGVLREEQAPTEPVDDSVLEVVERARRSGMLIDSEVDESRSDPDMVGRAVHRVVQEGLTNAAKHAPGAAVTVRVRRSEDETTVLVRNAKPPTGPMPGVVSGKQGLLGLAERVRLVGGTLRAEPCESDGFEVLATLPLDGSPSESDSASSVTRSESARAHQAARRQVRRSLIAAIVVPPAIMCCLLGIVGLVFLVNYNKSQLGRDDFAGLRIGETRQEMSPVLPRRQTDFHPADPLHPPPPGSDCEYYGVGGSVFDLQREVHRLCFADGRLVAKDVVKIVRKD